MYGWIALVVLALVGELTYRWITSRSASETHAADEVAARLGVLLEAITNDPQAASATGCGIALFDRESSAIWHGEARGADTIWAQSHGTSEQLHTLAQQATSAEYLHDPAVLQRWGSALPNHDFVMSIGYWSGEHILTIDC